MQTVPCSQIGRVISVAYAATVTPNADTTDTLIIGVLTGNLTIANPTGTPVSEQVLRVRIKQDGTGSRTVTLGNKFRLAASATLNWSTTAGATDRFAAVYNSTDDKWDIVSLVPGL